MSSLLRNSRSDFACDKAKIVKKGAITMNGVAAFSLDSYLQCLCLPV